MSQPPLPSTVTLVEVGPRDGLQNESQPIATTDKIMLIHLLEQAGLKHIETTSYVSPRWVPQMADNQAVMQGIRRRTGVRYAVLTPNLKGLQAALLAPHPPDEIVIFASASETFSQRNLNCSITQSLERFATVIEAAQSQGINVRATVSCALGCPFEGDITPNQVEHVVRQLKAIGAHSCDIADTIGVGTPRKVQAVMDRALQHFDLHQLSAHFHDTYGQALTNIYACLELGIHTFDTSIAGLGGCPYAKGATGNVATEDVLFMLNGLGIETGIHMPALLQTSTFISQVLGKPPASKTAQALLRQTQS